MALKAIRCPSCGGDLNLDDSREFGYCQFCGNKVVISDTLKVKFQNSAKIKNYLKLARDAFEDGKYLEAYGYYTKVLENNNEHPEALARRGICSSYMVNISNINVNELTRGYKEAIKILENKIKHSNSEDEIKNLNNDLQNILNDMTSYLVFVNRSFERVKNLETFDDEQFAVRYHKAILNFAQLVQNKILFLDIHSYLKEISDGLAESLSDQFSNYGIKLVNFNVNSIIVPEDDPSYIRLRNSLDRKAEFNILGTNYQQSRTFDVLQSAAENEGSNQFVDAGIGLGLGTNMGYIFGNLMNGVLLNTGNGQMAPASFRFYLALHIINLCVFLILLISIIGFREYITWQVLMQGIISFISLPCAPK